MTDDERTQIVETIDWVLEALSQWRIVHKRTWRDREEWTIERVEPNKAQEVKP